LVRVERVQYRWHKQKPYYAVRFLVLEPKHLARTAVASRLHLTAKALWKLAWFLRDFGYDTELLGREEIDEKRLTGLIGVIKISHTTISGRSYLNLDAFAKSGEWDQFSSPSPTDARSTEPEVA
jgi:hypothetical protein